MSKKEFKIKKVQFTNKTFRLPQDLVQRLGQASNQVGCSMNEFTIQALEYALENLIVEENENDDK